MDYRLDSLRYQVREDPSSRLFYQLGELLRKIGELDEAATVLQQGLEKHPRYVAAWVSLGRTLMALSSHAEAELAFTRALELDPENAVAARMIGETAVGREDWLQAIKALKLARALSPRDDSLDDQIALVEKRLAEKGMLERKPEPAPVSTVPRAAREIPQQAASLERRPTLQTQPFERDELMAAVEEEKAAAEAARGEEVAEAGDEERPREVVHLSNEEPFDESPPTLDSGAWERSHDVFAIHESAAQAQTPSEEVEELPLGEPDDGLEPEVADDDLYPEEEVAEDVPVPTITLARLALEQGDRDLAEKTLIKLLASNPEDEEAAELLVELRGVDHVPAAGSHATRSQARAKVAALRGWLKAVRLAAERRAP